MVLGCYAKCPDLLPPFSGQDKKQGIKTWYRKIISNIIVILRMRPLLDTPIWIKESGSGHILNALIRAKLKVKTMKKFQFIDVGRKPQRFVPEKTHAVK